MKGLIYACLGGVFLTLQGVAAAALGSHGVSGLNSYKKKKSPRPTWALVFACMIWTSL